MVNVKIEVPKQRVPANPEVQADRRGNNLKDVTFTLPVGLFYLHHRRLSSSGKST